jgi:hypothetical protein
MNQNGRGHLGRFPRESTPDQQQSIASSGKISCKYGEKCYRKNRKHLEKYSHPHPHQPNDDLHKHLALAEKQFYVSTAGLDNTNRYFEMNAKMKMAMYHQQLPNELQQALNHRDIRQIEKQQILETRRDIPNYWGVNTFDQPYCQIEIHPESSEFNTLCELMNHTIGTHDNKYGTIYGRDPTEFIVTNITRIHNRNLWHVYCFRKVSIITFHHPYLRFCYLFKERIIEKTGKRLEDYDSSKYLKDRPLLVPLLDASANEYWL